MSGGVVAPGRAGAICFWASLAIMAATAAALGLGLRPASAPADAALMALAFAALLGVPLLLVLQQTVFARRTPRTMLLAGRWLAALWLLLLAWALLQGP